MDTREFEKTAKRLRPLMLTTSRQLLGRCSEAEDIVQDAMLRLWSIRDELGRYSSPEALAVTIVRRLSINELRQRRPDTDIDSIDVQLIGQNDLDDYDNRETDEYIDYILRSLPDSQQTLIRLRHIEGYDNGDIARLLGSSEGAVRTALCRARQHIAEIFLATQNR